MNFEEDSSGPVDVPGPFQIRLFNLAPPNTRALQPSGGSSSTRTTATHQTLLPSRQKQPETSQELYDSERAYQCRDPSRQASKSACNAAFQELDPDPGREGEGEQSAVCTFCYGYGMAKKKVCLWKPDPKECKLVDSCKALKFETTCEEKGCTWCNGNKHWDKCSFQPKPRACAQ